MGVDHIFYAEVRIGDKWHGLNTCLRDFVTGERRVFPLADGKSILYEAYDRIVDSVFSVPGLPDDLSEELAEHLINGEGEVDYMGQKISHREYLSQMAFWAKYDMTVRDTVVFGRTHKFKGYVPKSILADIVDGTAEDFYWLDQDDYDNLTDEKKCEYTYHEWEDTSTWYQQFVRIYEQVEILLRWIRENAYSLTNGNMALYGKLRTVGPGDVRLIILRI